MKYTVKSTVLIPLGRKQGEEVTGKELDECGIGEMRAVEIGAVEAVASAAPKPAAAPDPAPTKPAK